MLPLVDMLFGIKPFPLVGAELVKRGVWADEEQPLPDGESPYRNDELRGLVICVLRQEGRYLTSQAIYNRIGRNGWISNYGEMSIVCRMMRRDGLLLAYQTGAHDARYWGLEGLKLPVSKKRAVG